MQERDGHFDIVERSINRVMKFCYSEASQKNPAPAELWMDIGIICGGFMRAREELAKHEPPRLKQDLKFNLEVLEQEDDYTEGNQRKAAPSQENERSKSPFTPIGEIGKESE